jgi:hypothetical protein
MIMNSQIYSQSATLDTSSTLNLKTLTSELEDLSKHNHIQPVQIQINAADTLFPNSSGFTTIKTTSAASSSFNTGTTTNNHQTVRHRHREAPTRCTHERIDVTYWVTLGDSITFGELSDTTIRSTQQKYQYIWRKDNVTLSTAASVPYFSIHKSTFLDSGHYQCYRILAKQSKLFNEQIKWKDADIIVETTIRISSK